MAEGMLRCRILDIVLKGEPSGFPDRLGRECEKEEYKEGSWGSGLSKWSCYD